MKAKSKSTTILLLILLLTLTAVFTYALTQILRKEIKTYTDCIQSGYPVIETYPPQCRTPEGKNFIFE